MGGSMHGQPQHPLPDDEDVASVSPPAGEPRPRAWSAERSAFAGLVILVGLLFHSAVLGRGVFYYRDIHLFWHPQIEALLRCVRMGSWPVWDPSLAFGRPLLANPNVQVFYPPTWLNLLLPPGTYYTLYVLAHFLLTAAGFQALARQVGLSRTAAFVGAAVWTASGPLTSLVSLWNYLAGACWWPWAFVAADRALESGRLRPALAWGACVAAPVLGGSPEMALMGSIAVGLFALRRVAWRRPWLAANRPVVRGAVIAAAFALALSAAQWLPTLAVTAGTPRLDLPIEARTFWSVHPMSLLQLVLPAKLDDLPLRWEVRRALFDGREPLLPSLYLGLCALALAGAALASSRHPLRRFAAVLGLAALLVALGRHTPAYTLAATLLPPIRAIRYPVKAMALAAFAWALLCAIGWDVWRAPAEGRPWRWRLLVIAPLSAAVALGAGATWLTRFGAEEWGRVLLSTGGGRPITEILGPTALRIGGATVLGAIMLALALRRAGGAASSGAGALAAVVVIADLLLAHHDPSPLASPEVFTYRPPVVDLIRSAPRSRIYSYDYLDPGLALRQRPLAASPEVLAGTPETWPVPWTPALAARQRLYPYLVGVFGLDGSFHRDTLGLYPSYLLWLNLAERATEGTPTMVKILRMGSVSHVVALHDQGFEDLVPVARLPALLVEPVRLFRVPDPLPRAYAVGGARVGDGREGLRILTDPGFDPAREVLLPSGPSAASPDTFQGEVRVLEWRPDRLRLESRLDRAGYVVLAEGYDPGWSARVDGRRAFVLRANVGLRAVAVSAGTHVVELAYRPLAITLGLVVSASALLLAGAAMATARATGDS
jgi:membrane protein YfhO